MQAQPPYAAGPDYVHAARAGELLLVSGTMGLRPDGTPGADLAEQLDLAWANVAAVLDGHGLGLADVVRVTSYLRDAAFAEANAGARLAALGGRRVPTTAIVVELLEDDWLVELEVLARRA